MIASIALELVVLGLATWQLVVIRRSIRADKKVEASEEHRRREARDS